MSLKGPFQPSVLGSIFDFPREYGAEDASCAMLCTPPRTLEQEERTVTRLRTRQDQRRSVDDNAVYAEPTAAESKKWQRQRQQEQQKRSQAQKHYLARGTHEERLAAKAEDARRRAAGCPEPSASRQAYWMQSWSTVAALALVAGAWPRQHGPERGSTFQRKPACKEDLQACGPVCSENGYTRGIYRLIGSFLLGAAL